MVFGGYTACYQYGNMIFAEGAMLVLDVLRVSRDNKNNLIRERSNSNG